MARSPSGFHQRRTVGELAADSGGVGVEFARPEARAAMNAPSTPTPVETIQTEHCPMCGQPIDRLYGPQHGFVYPEPPDPSHDGPEPCDTPALYRVENVK